MDTSKKQSGQGVLSFLFEDAVNQAVRRAGGEDSFAGMVIRKAYSDKVSSVPAKKKKGVDHV